MKFAAKCFKILSVFLSVLVGFIFLMVAVADKNTETNYKVIANGKLSLECKVPIKVKPTNNISVDGKLFNNVGSNYAVEFKVFGIIPVKKANVEVVDDMYVSVLGTPFGMKIYTDGVLVIDISDVDSKNGYVKPARESGLQIGDFIISIDGQQVFSNGDVAGIIENSHGKQLDLVIRRDNVIKKIKLTPILSNSTGVFKAGIWVRDSSAGIGTLTFHCPTTNVLCGLGHPVSDGDTGKTLTVSSGEMVAAEIVAFTRGEKGSPGELHGRLLSTKYAKFNLNCNSGVYGIASGVIPTGQMLQVALKQEIRNGTAYIISTVDGNGPKQYKCNVTINKTSSETQNLLVQITDQELLKITGGILQGMSGSPLIQNGKLIGAVTHVLIDEPTKGYGIFAENMLETAQSVADQQKLKEAS